MLAALLGALSLFAAASAQAQSVPTNVLTNGALDGHTLTVTPGDEKLDLTWLFSSNAGTHWWVQYKRQTDTAWTTSTSTVTWTSPSHSITGLTGGILYDVRVFGTITDKWHSVPGPVPHRQRHADGDGRQAERHRHPGLRVHGHQHVGAAFLATQSHAGAGHGAVCGLQPCELRWRAARRRAQMDRTLVRPSPERQKHRIPAQPDVWRAAAEFPPVSPDSSGGSGTITRSRQAAPGSSTAAAALLRHRPHPLRPPLAVAVLLPVAVEDAEPLPLAETVLCPKNPKTLTLSRLMTAKRTTGKTL